jgi:plastocyanin
MARTQGTARKSFSFCRSLVAGLLLAFVVLPSSISLAEDGSVRGTVRVLHQDEANADSGDVVVSLTPVEGRVTFSPGSPAQLMQKNKKFVPHILAVMQGAEIEIPNHDLFFHNLSSIHHGKTSDLGLYESGKTRKIRFKQPGISYIFCNIHPEMSAVVVVLRTRYFALTGPEGNFEIHRVPPGRYRLAVWYELTPEAEARSQEREITVTAGSNEIGKIVLHSSDTPKEHPNKDGEPYFSSGMESR